MTRQIINVGTVLNDGKGDDLRSAFIKVNENFRELFVGGVAGTNLQIVNNTISSIQGNIYLAPVGLNPVIVGNTNPLYVTDSSVSISSTTGALIVTGGIGTSGNINVDGRVTTPRLSASDVYGDNFYYSNGAVFNSSTYSDSNVNAILNSLGNLSAINFVAQSAVYSPGYFYSNGTAFVGGGGATSGLDILDGGTASTIFDFTDTIIDGGGA
jgi:hypothetical protein